MGVELPPQQILEYTTDPLLVVEVIGADRTEATIGNPPLVSFRVLEVLHGDVTPGEIIHAFWDDFSDPFYAMRGGGDSYARHMASPLAVPRAGEKMIVTGTRFVPPPPGPPPDPNQPRPPMGGPFDDGRPRAVLPAQGGFVLSRRGRLDALPEVVEPIRKARASRSGT